MEKYRCCGTLWHYMKQVTISTAALIARIILDLGNLLGNSWQQGHALFSMRGGLSLQGMMELKDIHTFNVIQHFLAPDNVADLCACFNFKSSFDLYCQLIRTWHVVSDWGLISPTPRVVICQSEIYKSSPWMTVVRWQQSQIFIQYKVFVH